MIKLANRFRKKLMKTFENLSLIFDHIVYSIKSMMQIKVSLDFVGNQFIVDKLIYNNL